MTSGETFFRSPLDKPLDQLTEEDISQITREDCRRYLKEKGMRRPSWNKSQAIQQVISLKALLETRTDSGVGAGIRHMISVTRPANPPFAPLTSTDSVKVTNADIQISASADESVPYRRKDSPKPALPGNLSCRLLATDTTAISPRTMGATNGTLGQMTIFYHGKVNVYNGVPADKAHTIMQLAAKPIHSPQDAPDGGITAVQSFPCHLQATSVRLCTIPHAMISPMLQTAKMTEKSQHFREEGYMSCEVEPEVPTSRKASLQRYLKKKKDRFKSKRKRGGPSSSSLEMYLSHQVRSETPNGQSSRSSTCSPPQPRPPHTPTRCSSVENQVNIVSLSVDPTEKDNQIS